MNPSLHAITFKSGDDELVGILHLPDDAKQLGVLILVGGPQYRVGAHRQFLQWARAFARAGFPAMRFDYAGVGDSAGEFRGFEHTDADIASALAKLTDAQPQLKDVCLVGLCDGASAALMHGARLPGVSRLILINPWVWSEASESQTFVKHYYRGRITDPDFWKALFTGKVKLGAAVGDFCRRLIGSKRSAAGQAATADAYQSRMAQGLRDFPGQTLIVLADSDLVAKDFEDHAARDAIWRHVLQSDGVRIVHIEDADHTFSRPAAHEHLLKVMLDWLTR